MNRPVVFDRTHQPSFGPWVTSSSGKLKLRAIKTVAVEPKRPLKGHIWARLACGSGKMGASFINRELAFGQLLCTVSR